MKAAIYSKAFRRLWEHNIFVNKVEIIARSARYRWLHQRLSQAINRWRAYIIAVNKARGLIHGFYTGWHDRNMYRGMRSWALYTRETRLKEEEARRKKEHARAGNIFP